MRHQLLQLHNPALNQPNSTRPRIRVPVLELQIYLLCRQAHKGELHFWFPHANDEDFAAEFYRVDGAVDGGFDACAFERDGGLDAAG